nr:lipase 3-like [Onthophagus taurus]
MHRIPYGLKSGPAENKPVVFVMHGLLSSSADWVNMGPEKSLGFLLADLGYDVWMGNARGTTYSRNHISLDPDKYKSDFWDFSWNEIGEYDLPAMIDYVLSYTKQEKLFYIGHSQGTTSFYVMCSEKPAYNNKIRVMISLAPVAYMDHMENPLFRFVAAFDGPLEFLTQLIGIAEFLPDIEFLGSIGKVFCKDGAIFQEVCAGVIFLIGGFDSEQLNRTMIPVIMTNTPAGAATKQLLHYAQDINSGEFRKYDYGLIQNLIKYGSVSPPSYNLNKITAPVAMIYSKNDWLAATVDVERLAKELPNMVYKYLIPFEKFNHLDFLWAVDIIPLAYNYVFDLLKQY